MHGIAVAYSSYCGLLFSILKDEADYCVDIPYCYVGFVIEMMCRIHLVKNGNLSLRYLCRFTLVVSCRSSIAFQINCLWLYLFRTYLFRDNQFFGVTLI